jgi:L-2-hydroxyglutarate oxidase LhgO
MDSNVIIIGAGVIGMAVGRAIAEKYDSVYIVEANEGYGQEISSRNSEVVHSGVYYPRKSFKSKLCIKGRKLLYKYCDKKNIPFRKTGKLVVGYGENGLGVLKEIKSNALSVSVRSELLNEKEILSIEPNIIAEHALYFKDSGIVDSHSLMKSLEYDCISRGVDIAYKNEVVAIEQIAEGGYLISLKDSNNELYDVSSNVVVNCAGLNSYLISSMLGISDARYELSYWKGEYFSLSSNSKTRIKTLIYPTPEKNITGLGIHATIDLGGRVKLGPNAVYLGEELKHNYRVDNNNKESFFKAARVYLPGLRLEDLNPDQAGIRPKLQKPGDLFRDFIIKNESERGFNNFINLIGIESPGLTACLSIGEYVSELIDYEVL